MHSDTIIGAELDNTQHHLRSMLHDQAAAFFGKAGGTGYKFGEKKYPARPKMDVPTPNGRTGLGKGVRVRHPKYGEGVLVAREGDGDDAKITVQFNGHGTKKLVEKFAQLERI